MTAMPTKKLKLWIFILLACLSLNGTSQTLSSDKTSENGGQENLTDKEQWMKENYVNQGYINRAYQEECGAEASQKKQQKCRGRDAGGEYAGIDSSTVKMVARIYGVVLGQAGSKLALKAKESVDETTNEEPDPDPGEDGNSGGSVDDGTRGNGNGTDTDNQAQAQGGNDTSTDNPTQDSGDRPTSDEDVASADNSGDDPSGDGNADSDQGQNKNEEEKEMEDYCKYIAMGTETLGMVQQQMGQKQIQESPTQPGNEQRESLYKAARAHDERAKAAKIQMYGWGATFTCYSVMWMSQPIKPDWKFILKWSGSGILAHFFSKEKSRHEDYADDMRDIANDFPGRGDCDPIQERNCYCSQPETKYDPKYCMPQEMQASGRKLSNKPGELSCIDGQMNPDPSCECHATNSCYDQVVQQKLSNLDFGEGLNNGQMDAFGKMMRGQIDQGRVSGATYGQNAVAKKIRPELSKDNPLNKNPGRISKGQQRQAELLEEYGVPKNIARNIAKKPMSKDAKKQLAKLKNSGSFNSSSRVASRGSSRGNGNQVIRFGGGDGLNKSNNSRDRGKKDNPFSSFMNRGKKKKKNTRNNAEVLNFRERASRKAQISRKKDYSVFDIISHRYRVSGWKRLDYNQ